MNKIIGLLLFGIMLFLVSPHLIIAPSVDPYVVCHANNRFCEGTQIWECNEYGTVTNFVEDCGQKECVQSGNQAYCTDKSSLSGLAIGIIIGAFIVIIIFVIWYNKHKYKKHK